MSNKQHDMSRMALVGSDLDGTLLNEHGRIPDETKDRIAEWRSLSGRFAIVTGRPPWDLFAIIGETGISQLLDAVICEERDIYLRKGSDWTRLGDHDLQLALELSCMPDAEIVAAAMVAEATARGIEPHRSSPEIEAKRGYIEMYFQDPEDSERARRVAEECIQGNGFFLSVMRNVRHVSLRHPYSKKGTTLRALADFWGLYPGQVAAVGDSLNDMSMLDGTYGFLGAAVSNSDPAIIKVVQGSGVLLPQPRSMGVAHLLGLLIGSREHNALGTVG